MRRAREVPGGIRTTGSKPCLTPGGEPMMGAAPLSRPRLRTKEAYGKLPPLLFCAAARPGRMLARRIWFQDLPVGEVNSPLAVQSNRAVPRTVGPMYHSDERRCPRCGGIAHRVRRRTVDRFLSMLVLRYRFRCGAMGCGWEGNLPAKAPAEPITIRPS